MSITSKQKLFLAFLLVATIILFTTYYKYPFHPDHYTLGQYSYVLIEKGYAPWVLHPISLFGYYPLSVPSGFEFFFAILHNITGLDLPLLFYLFSIITAAFTVAGAYLIMREFTSFETSFLTAFILSTIVHFVKNVSNTASSRMFNIMFYPIFILCLFKVFKLYKKEKKLSIKYIIVLILLFMLMNLIHRFGQLLVIFLISFFAALIFVNFENIISWAKNTKIYHIRKKFYSDSVLFLYIDLMIATLIFMGFFLIKIRLIEIFLTFTILIHYFWFDVYKPKVKYRSDDLLLLDMIILIFYLIIAKTIDLLVRGRLSANVLILIEKYSFQLTIVSIVSVLLLTITVYAIIKKYKSLKHFFIFIQNKTLDILLKKPDKAISWSLLLVFLFLFSRNFTGGNFYRFGLSYYTESFLLKGESPWIILVNFIFNLNNNVTILIYFAFIGVAYLFLKENKTFYDYFLVFVALGFSQFLLDWEYIRLYFLPIYGVFIGIGLIFLIEKLSKKFSKKTIFTVLILLFVAHLAVANVFIQRERFLPILGFVESEQQIPENYFISAGNYLQDKGNFSIQITSIVKDDSKTAYYAQKVNSVIAQSIFTEDKEYEIEKKSLSSVWEDFHKGKKIIGIYRLKDPVYGQYYYHGKHIYNLNKRRIYDENIRDIIDMYNIAYAVNSPESPGRTRFFESIEPIKNKVYSSNRLNIYYLNMGRYK